MNTRMTQQRKNNGVSMAAVIGLLLTTFNGTALFWTSRSRVDDWVVTRQATTTSSSPHHTSTSPKIKGVFVIKAARAEHAAKTLCSLTHFFNANYRYPVRIFVDTAHVADNVLATLHALAGNQTDLKVVADPNQKWTQLPSHFNATQRGLVLEQCQDFEFPERALCTTMKVPLGYVYMNYWNYAIMPYEPELKPFDYILNFDTDAFLTQPWSVDPFEIMDRHQLTGLFDILAFQSGDIASGIQESVNDILPDPSKRTNKYLDILPWFDADGTWQSLSPNPDDEYPMRPSVWTHFWGVRRDFFESASYKQFAKNMAFYTYLYRTDEQPVIGAAFAVLCNNSATDIWYLPARGIQLGVYHHGWVDNREMIQMDTKNQYAVNTLHQWSRFVEHHDQVLSWEHYLRLSGNDVGWDACATATTK